MQQTDVIFWDETYIALNSIPEIQIASKPLVALLAVIPRGLKSIRPKIFLFFQRVGVRMMVVSCIRFPVGASVLQTLKVVQVNVRANVGK